MHALVVALLVILGVDEEAVTGVDVVHRFQVDLQAALSSRASVREVAALGVVLLLDLVQHLIRKYPLVELALVFHHVVLHDLLDERLLFPLCNGHVVVEELEGVVEERGQRGLPLATLDALAHRFAPVTVVSLVAGDARGLGVADELCPLPLALVGLQVLFAYHSIQAPLGHRLLARIRRASTFPGILATQGLVLDIGGL